MGERERERKRNSRKWKGRRGSGVAESGMEDGEKEE